VDTSEQVVAKRVRRRQRRSIEEKLKIVEKTFEPGASVAEVARAYGVNANQVFTWRRKYRQGQVVKAGPNLLPVRVVRTSGGKKEHPRSNRTHEQHLGQIQIELLKANVMVSGSVDVEALRVVLEKLAG
jgi:transposase